MAAGIGRAHAFGHHGEILQGIFECGDAILRRGLVSLPCSALKAKAVFRPSDHGSVRVTPVTCEKARLAANLTLSSLRYPDIGGHLNLESNIPIGRGMGSSTADVVAAILAVHSSFKKRWNVHDVMRLAVQAETACDSTLFDQQAVLFAQRDAVLIEAFTKPLPRLDIVSVDVAPGSTVSTLDLEPAKYGAAEVELFRVIRSMYRRAVEDGDLGLLGRTATASARVNERFLPKPGFVEIERIGQHVGALGVQVAHSGTLIGLLFEPRAARTPQNLEKALRALQDIGFKAKVFRG